MPTSAAKEGCSEKAGCSTRPSAGECGTRRSTTCPTGPCGSSRCGSIPRGTASNRRCSRRRWNGTSGPTACCRWFPIATKTRFPSCPTPGCCPAFFTGGARCATQSGRTGELYLCVLEGGPVVVNGERVTAPGSAMIKEEAGIEVSAEEDAELLLVDVLLTRTP